MWERDIYPIHFYVIFISLNADEQICNNWNRTH